MKLEASSFPNPVESPGCRANRPGVDRICDPEGLMTDAGAQAANEAVWLVAGSVQNRCRHARGGSGPQIAVALIDDLNLPWWVSWWSGSGVAVEAFGRAVHDKWGVGDKCGSGVVLTLSRAQRYVYVSTGKAAKELAPAAYLDEVIERMRPRLRARDFDGAVLGAVRDLGLVLSGEVHRPGATGEAAVLATKVANTAWWPWQLGGREFWFLYGEGEAKEAQEPRLAAAGGGGGRYW
jgi:hypothetical protein